jgi:hypothetical protein
MTQTQTANDAKAQATNNQPNWSSNQPLADRNQFPNFSGLIKFNPAASSIKTNGGQKTRWFRRGRPTDIGEGGSFRVTRAIAFLPLRSQTSTGAAGQSGLTVK